MTFPRDIYLHPKPVDTGVTGITSGVLKTGITSDYGVTGSDGDTEIGEDFFVLPVVASVQQLNHFGSKWRKTGITGGYYDHDTSQFKDVTGTVTTKALAFPDYLVIDWLTLNWNNDFVMYSVTSSGLGIRNLTYSDACNNPPASVGSFSGNWNVAQINQLLRLQFKGRMQYEPFSPGHGSVWIISSSPAEGAASIGATHYLQSNLWTAGTTTANKSAAAAGNVFAIYVRITNISEL